MRITWIGLIGVLFAVVGMAILLPILTLVGIIISAIAFIRLIVASKNSWTTTDNSTQTTSKFSPEAVELIESVYQSGFVCLDVRGKILYVHPEVQNLDITFEKLIAVAREQDEDFVFEKLMAKSEFWGPRKIQFEDGTVKNLRIRSKSGAGSIWVFDSSPILSTKLSQKHDLLNEVIEGSPLGIVTVFPDGKIHAHNQKFLDMVNLSFMHSQKPPCEQTLKGQSLVSLINAAHSHDAMSKLQSFFGGEHFREPFEAYLINDTIMPFNIYTCLINHKDDLRTLYFVDVSEHKKLSTQLSQSQKMQAIGQLAGGIAHDFNNLLTAMIGYCDLLMLRYAPGDLSFHDVMQIKQNANRAANLVRQLLAFSRQQTLQPKVIDVTDALAELSVLLQRLIGPTIEFRVVHGRQLGTVKVDQGQLEQVIINLTVNARDAMPEGGRLTIATSNLSVQTPFVINHETAPSGEYVVIRVTDTGVGIPPENLSRIFDPFFSTKEVGAGTGLGLSTVYGIVKQTGGFVAVESQLSKGTSFTIYLPRNAEQVTEVALEPVETMKIADLSGSASILLVEDEDAVRLFSARALRDKGYKVFDASSGSEALKILDDPEVNIDLVVTDVVMAPMDGPTMVKKILEKLPGTRIIFISGYAEDSFRSELRENESVHFLAKPFSLKDLARKVKEVLLKTA